ncbi:hypothetical protein SDC9_184040 [bioreactor metagenome]|uniref:Zincin peptidase n=1 Tax=bioreactor metagenome TaxID=1076179 RepID=A0A645HBW5_9ZZZZ
MRYAKSIPTVDLELKNRLTAEGWIQLKEPSSPASAFLFSIPFLLLNAVISLILIYMLHPPFLDYLNFGFDSSITLSINLNSILYVLGVVFLFAVHEMMHAFCIPNWIRSDKTFWGINNVGIFIYTSEIISRRTFIIISIMPFLCLSIVSPILLSALGWLNGYTILLCLINAMGSSIDILNLFLILTQTPTKAMIMANGPETYYQKRRFS